MSTPPPLPSKRRISGWLLFLVVACFIVGVFVVLFVLAVGSGRLRDYSIPTDGMKPAVSRGDHVLMEGITYLFRPPREGEIVIFRTDGLPGVKQGIFYLERIVGKPGDSLRIAGGKLYVNGQPFPFSNAEGEITYTNSSYATYLSTDTETLTVPDGHYFLLGDNSANSLDCRFFGPVPAKNIRGRILGRH